MANRVNTPNWNKIKAEYIRGGISQQKLAEKYGVSYSTVHRRALKEQWGKQRAEREKKANQKIVEKIADIQADMAMRLFKMQAEATLVVYGKLMETLKSFSGGDGTKNVREKLEIKKLDVNGEARDFPLRKTFTSDIEAIVRSMTALARLYGIDAASILAAEQARIDRGIKQNDNDGGFLEALDEVRPETWGIADAPQNIADTDDAGSEADI